MIRSISYAWPAGGCGNPASVSFALCMLMIAVVLASALGTLPARADAGMAAEAAPPPLGITVFTSTRHDVCYDSGNVAAIRALAKREVERINRSGGTNGRRLVLTFKDDDSEVHSTIANLQNALADPTTLAMIGLGNSNRAQAAFDAAGKEVSDSGVPFISNISVAAIFAKAPNVLSMQVSQDEERVPMLVQFLRRSGYKRIAFAGISSSVFSNAVGDALKEELGALLVADQRLASLTDDDLDDAAVAAAVSNLRDKAPDMLVLGVSNKRAGELLAALGAAEVKPALFAPGRIDSLPEDIISSYPNAIYQIAWTGLPDADNDRVRRLVSADPPETWVFEGRKVSEATGWTNGECKARPAVEVPNPFEAANQRAIQLGAQFADMIALVAEAANSAPIGSDLAFLRQHVRKELTTTYAAGRGVFRGSFETWSFNPKTRTAARSPFIVVQPKGLGRPQLAPIQFVRTKDGGLREVETLYLDVDLVRASRIDDNDKTFIAELYLSMRASSKATIKDIEFTNAYLDPETNGRQITVEALHEGGDSDAYPSAMRIYKVTGRFTFDPDLQRFPFDTQRFTIDMQPKRADQPFVVQPPPLDLRDKNVFTDGWDVRSQYVGYGDDVVPLLDALTHEPSVVPFYKASFVWLMKRQTTDYFLRVVVPLGFILIVAYFSYFININHFEAIVTIQVTALLSAVALYLSLPKLNSDDASISDRLFVFNYMMVSIMIGISILRVSRLVEGRPWLKQALGVAHVLGVPAVVAMMALYVRGVTML